MEKFKRPFYKTNTFRTILPAIACLVVVLWIGGVSPYDFVVYLVHIDSRMLSAIVWSGIVFVCPLLFFGCFWLCFSIEMDSHSLLVRNYFIPFIKKRYLIADIYQCKIYYHAPAAVHYMQLKLKGKKRWGMYYGLDMLTNEHIEQILSFLEGKGIIVSDTNIR